VYSFYCRLYAAGAQRALNGTCNILEDASIKTQECPVVNPAIQPMCTPTGQRGSGNILHHFQWYTIAIIALCLIVAGY